MAKLKWNIPCCCKCGTYKEIKKYRCLAGQHYCKKCYDEELGQQNFVFTGWGL